MSDWKNFDPNGTGVVNAGIFGLPYNIEEAQVVLIPAPWYATSVTTKAQEDPSALYYASRDIGLYHPSYGVDTWKIGVAMLPLSKWEDAQRESKDLRDKALAHAEILLNGEIELSPDNINMACDSFHARIEKTSSMLLDQNKLVGVVGGDSSVSLGLIKALSVKYADFGILQVGSRPNLKEAFQGFIYSDRSVMYNALKLPAVMRLVQVGLSDFSPAEKTAIDESDGRIKSFFNDEIHERQFKGARWLEVVNDVVSCLPDKVYVSFTDNDLTHTETMFLLQELAISGKAIIGFDLSGTTGKIGAQTLWNLANWSAKSNNLKPLEQAEIRQPTTNKL